MQSGIIAFVPFLSNFSENFSLSGDRRTNYDPADIVGWYNFIEHYRKSRPLTSAISLDVLH
jgi:hypothetical protein